MFYKLNEDNLPVECFLIDWHNNSEGFYNKPLRYNTVEQYLISTVFLGMEDLLFETSVLDKEGYESYRKSYKTYEDAMKGHDKVLDYYQLVNLS